MNAVLYYSNTKQSLKIAQYFSQNLSYPLMDIHQSNSNVFNNLILVFPVYSQNIPPVVFKFLKKVKVQYLTVIATYGKICCGNVLYEIQAKLCLNIIAGAYIPTKHAYLEEDECFNNYELLKPIIEKIKTPTSIKIPKLYKNFFSNFFPNLRSRLGLQILRDSSCNLCGTCTEICEFHAIENGRTNRRCIRCLKCVTICPKNALSIKKGFLLRIYLRRNKKSNLIIYV